MFLTLKVSFGKQRKFVMEKTYTVTHDLTATFSSFHPLLYNFLDDKPTSQIYAIKQKGGYIYFAAD